MQCPRCSSGDIKAMATNNRDAEVTVRKRGCNACGHVWFTVELPDRFVIAPHIYGPIPTYHPEQRPTAEDFSYASNTNDVWLSEEDARRILAEIEVK